MAAMTLGEIPAKYAQPDPSSLAKLPKPLKKDSEKGRCDVCGGYHGLPAIHLDYQGHAELTLSLIEIDPDWSWEPFAVDPQTGTPVIGLQNNRVVMWGRLTLLGKTLPGVGTCEASKPDPEKELIGDFLRNAAMRFGVATKLWSKADGADPAGSGQGGYGQSSRKQAASRQTARPVEPSEPSSPVTPGRLPQRDGKASGAVGHPENDAATDAQVRLLAIECKKHGIEESDRVTFVAQLVGRPITSTHELTKYEVSRAIDDMKVTG